MFVTIKTEREHEKDFQAPPTGHASVVHVWLHNKVINTRPEVSVKLTTRAEGHKVHLTVYVLNSTRD